MCSEAEANFELLNNFILEYFRENKNLLKDVKDKFADFVDSNRLLQKIDTIEELLKVLKRMGLYRADEFTAIRIFKKDIDDSKFHELVERHQQLITGLSKRPRNRYAEKRGQIAADTSPPSITVPGLSMPADKRNQVFNVVASGISATEFATFARYLKFDDNEIKDIEVKNRDYQTRTKILLEKYETKRKTLKLLLNVLELMGRQDILRKIESLNLNL